MILQLFPSNPCESLNKLWFPTAGMGLPLVVDNWHCMLDLWKLHHTELHDRLKHQTRIESSNAHTNLLTLRSYIHAHTSKVKDITSWHLISASFCTPIGVWRSDTWKFITSMSDAPNVASTFTFSYMLNWTFLLVIERIHRRKLSLSTDRTCCSESDCDAAEVGMEVWHRAM